MWAESSLTVVVPLRDLLWVEDPATVEASTPIACQYFFAIAETMPMSCFQYLL
jgi:hypothetical protein